MSESTARFAGWFAYRAGQHLGFILRLAFVAGRQFSQPAKKQVSVFNTEEKGRTTEHTEKQGIWRFAQGCGHAPREGPKLAFSVCSIVPPFSSVLKTLTYLISGLFGAELYHLESNAPASCPGGASKQQLLGFA
jgi:hypothetical protein